LQYPHYQNASYDEIRIDCIKQFIFANGIPILVKLLQTQQYRWHGVEKMFSVLEIFSQTLKTVSDIYLIPDFFKRKLLKQLLFIYAFVNIDRLLPE